jgi:hypothetical protein
MTELFANFEVNRESRWQILLKLLGGSIVLHVVFLAVAIYVPSVRDAFNIAALVASTRFVDKDYNRTVIGNDVELLTITTEKFRYPPGYWLTADENAAAAAALLAGVQPPADPFAPKIISQASSGMGFTPETGPSPSPSPSPSPGASPSPSPQASPSPSSQIAAEKDVTTDKAEAEKQAEAQKTLEETAKQGNVSLPDENEINKKALKDFAAYANEQKKAGKLDLNKPFEITIHAEMDEKGNLKNAQVTKAAGDENLVELSTRMVAALNDSGLLTYLSVLKASNPGATLTITIKQDDSEIVAYVESEVLSPAEALKLAKTFNGLLVAGSLLRKGKDEAVVMQNTSVVPDGKKVVVKLALPRQTVIDMLQKQVEPGI